ncbi:MULTISPECIES: protein translocase subunit SecF [Thalassolituus]|jgi:preprotein translocase subunit SecF|uniref:protein translocase subunit SecF n=1 Tax=Thalassolituus TaxID=187492 RepID=UPI000C4C705C|nr:MULTISPECIES: protein translocase subunit SecF [Thalassolituus]MAX85774.1 protein translocase subunit SecF [Oceanospirillaceae bacterium]MEC9255703.1 protein translocase subunit SecF [Pseudomonadota bacterium]MEC9410941.1 protein translocase subunit SecF [Pseudomonadota bacterium]MED5441265.1 protein translocase subunit SecF [Pseudomonadota bacterium]MEE3161664.1 protein translocase subunit SecF [Pseudomonadota bacterium]|tara:strand:- start:1140 stop:2051 length:912 start_codon:yes stop_codon:yes gene_type:complete
MNTVNFMRFRHISTAISLTLLLISVVAIGMRGLNFGLDFTGGTLLEVEYETPVPLSEVKSVLDTAGYRDVVVQNFGSETDVLVRMSESFRDDLGNEVLGLLQTNVEDNSLTLLRSEFVGASVGEELRDQGGIAMLVALFVVMAYVAFRFQWKFSLGAVMALFHDVLIIVGMFALFQWEFDLNVLAALLAVIGYSLNDTIVVSDRIRENFRMMRIGSPAEIINESLTQTLGRTLMTSLTTILVLLALLFLGGDIIHNFALALTIGVGVGTYSSIYIAANLLLAFNVSREDLLPPELEEEGDEAP